MFKAMKVAVAAACVAFATQASAVTVNYNETDNLTSFPAIDYFGGGKAGKIDEWKLIELSQNAYVSMYVDSSSTVNPQGKKIYNNDFNAFKLDLYSASNVIPDAGAVSGQATEGALITSGHGSLTGLSLLAGNYLLHVTFNKAEQFTGYVTAISTVPLPGAALLFGSGLLGLGALGRKKSKAAQGTEVVAA